uniref:Uncharacterized protein n=1 Tax=Glossina austeni TaxID=7395 RepID=A0A1A9UN27_GLOAU
MNPNRKEANSKVYMKVSAKSHISKLKNIELINNTKNQQQTQQHNHSSDSDSALSSAPPSISPQPPANGVEPTDIWQTARSTYIGTKTPLRAASFWSFTVPLVANIQGFSTST